MNIKSVAVMVVSFTIQFILTFAISILTIRYYGPDITANLFYDLNLFTFIGLTASLGVPQILLRYQYLPDIDKNSLKATVNLITYFSFAIVLLLGVILGGYRTALLSFIVFFNFVQYQLRSTERFNLFIGLNLARFLVICGFCAYVFLTQNHNSDIWYLAMGGGYAAACFFLPRISLRSGWDTELAKRLLRHSIPILMYTLILQGVFVASQALSKGFSSDQVFQDYLITWKVIQIVQGFSALIFFIYPQFYFKHIGTNRNLVIKIQYLLIISIFLASTVLFFSKPILDTIFHYVFDPAILGILLLAESLRLITGVLNTKYTYHLADKYLLKNLFISVVATVLLLLIFFLVGGEFTSLQISLSLLFCFSSYFVLCLLSSRKLPEGH